MVLRLDFLEAAAWTLEHAHLEASASSPCASRWAWQMPREGRDQLTVALGGAPGAGPRRDDAPLGVAASAGEAEGDDAGVENAAASAADAAVKLAR
jgi:hypothetical protein